MLTIGLCTCQKQKITKDVPKGSVLGPVLYKILINDNTNSTLFSDDIIT